MSRTVRTLVVGTACPEAGDHVLGPALELARRLGAAAHVVHAYDLPSPIQAAYAREMFLAAFMGAHAGELRARLEAAVGERWPGGHVTCHALEGAAGECLARVAREVKADLVVVGAVPADPAGGRFPGATAESVARRARVPVLVLSDPARAVRRLLLTTDLSDASAAAHPAALGLARALYGAAETRCLLVVHAPHAPVATRADVVERLAHTELDRFLDERARCGDGVWRKVRVGVPAAEILAEAAGWPADLLMVGAGGRGARGALGGTGGSVVRGAPCNVLLMPVAAARPPRHAAVRHPAAALAV